MLEAIANLGEAIVLLAATFYLIVTVGISLIIKTIIEEITKGLKILIKSKRSLTQKQKEEKTVIKLEARI